MKKLLSLIGWGVFLFAFSGIVYTYVMLEGWGLLLVLLTWGVIGVLAAVGVLVVIEIYKTIR